MKRKDIINSVVSQFCSEAEMWEDEGYEYNSDLGYAEHYHIADFCTDNSYCFHIAEKWWADVDYTDHEWKCVVWEEEDGKPYPNISASVTQALNALDAEKIYFNRY